MLSVKDRVIKMAAERGITINGSNPADMQVHNEKFYSRFLLHGSLGLGESYMEGWWDAEPLDEFFFKVLSAKSAYPVRSLETVVNSFKAMILNNQSKILSKKVAEVHYDLSNEFYAAMLDSRMQYTCAYFKNTDDLEKAQEQKLDLICQKLHLKKGERVLELGCGWGGFAKFAAERYGVSVVAYNISKEQVAYARNNCAGLPVEIICNDYREATGEFDKVVSVGMCEHVGYKNYKHFMRLANQRLKDGGLFLLHTIASNESQVTGDPWLDKYIFPGAMLPSIKQLGEAMEGLFVMEDWHNFGTDYDKTLMAWFANFERNWHTFEDKFHAEFYRMWKYYLLCCAGLFRARQTQLWQVVLSKNGVIGGYTPVR